MVMPPPNVSAPAWKKNDAMSQSPGAGPPETWLADATAGPNVALAHWYAAMSSATTSAARSPAARERYSATPAHPARSSMPAVPTGVNAARSAAATAMAICGAPFSATLESRTTVTTNIPSTTGPNP
jgi:hypothetical protein